MTTFSKSELGILRRSLRRTVETMQSSRYVGEDDRHLLRCEELLEKTSKAERSAP